MSVSSNLPQSLTLSHTHTACLTALSACKDVYRHTTTKDCEECSRFHVSVTCWVTELPECRRNVVTGWNRSHRCRKARIRNLCVHVQEEVGHPTMWPHTGLKHCHGTGNVAFPKQTYKQGASCTENMTGSQNEMSSTDIWSKSHFSVTQALHLHCTQLKETMISMGK